MNPTPHRERLKQAIAQRGQTRSLFALAMDLSIPYPQAHKHLERLEKAGQVRVTRYCRGFPLVITWIGDE